jgi:hypothetical protein
VTEELWNTSFWEFVGLSQALVSRVDASNQSMLIGDFEQ